ncbi:MAG: hypothetical protein DVB23_002059 [Verrucomicrobia bacterium]|nr:MAG: hypothetical protein DVB23_002059 [Verrucomicrobiota bacterium]
MWLGEDYWPQRLAAWRVREGGAECVAGPDETGPQLVRVLTQRLGAGPGGFVIELRFEAARPVETGIRFGDGESGWSVGCGRDGTVTLGREAGEARADGAVAVGGRRLRIEGTEEGGALSIRSTIFDLSGAKLSEGMEIVDGGRVSGPISFYATGGTRLLSLRMEGPRLVTDHRAHFGPVAGAMHTLSRGVLKLTAQLLPMGADDPDRVFLETARQGVWETIGESVIESPGWTATFRVPNWREGEDVAYRLVYGEHTWGGTVRRNPVDRMELNVAAMAGSGALLTEAVPAASAGMRSLVRAVGEAKPDLLFFPGGQASPGMWRQGVDATGMTLDYLQGWYLWHASFRELTRDMPCVVLPGPGDVFQESLWGEGGRPALKETLGGYVHPASFVQVVQRTQTSHLPDPVEPAPVQQGLPVFFTEMTYGRIGFAVIEDHKWKSGCQGIGLPLPEDDRPELVSDVGLDPRQLDLPGLKLWGDRQMAFLERWAADWTQTDLKVALSGALLAQMATNQGPDLAPVGADLSANGWPQSGRRLALQVLRKAGAFHLALDGGLPSVIRHGLETHDDAVHSYAVPVLAPPKTRFWKPRSSGGGRESGQPFWMGQHVDGLRNPITVVAVGQPGPVPGGQPPGGFAMVRLDRSTRKIRCEALTRLMDQADDVWAPMDGWPVILSQEDNFAGPARSWLPPLQVSGIAKPVVQVWAVSDGKLVYARRLREPTFTPWVLEPGRYDVRIGDPDTGLWIDLKGVEAAEEPYREARVIEF